MTRPLSWASCSTPVRVVDAGNTAPVFDRRERPRPVTDAWITAPRC